MLLRELQRKKDTVKCDMLTLGPRTLSKTAGADLDWAFVEKALFYTEP